MSITLTDVLSAREVIAGHVVRTPMLPAPRLSELTGASVYVKYENLQVTNSFKERGARNKLASLSGVDRGRGVIAMSAGNHAQAVAFMPASSVSGDRGDAGDDALRQSGSDPCPRGAGRARWRKRG